MTTTEHAKPLLDAMRIRCDDYTMKQNHFKLKFISQKLSKTQLFFSGCYKLINEGLVSFSLFHILPSFILQSSLGWPRSPRIHTESPRLTSEPKGSTCLCLPSTGIASTCHHTQLSVTVEGGSRVQSPSPGCMHGQPVDWLSHLPSLSLFSKTKSLVHLSTTFSEAGGLVKASVRCEKEISELCGPGRLSG